MCHGHGGPASCTNADRKRGLAEAQPRSYRSGGPRWGTDGRATTTCFLTALPYIASVAARWESKSCRGRATHMPDNGLAEPGHPCARLHARIDCSRRRLRVRPVHRPAAVKRADIRVRVRGRSHSWLGAGSGKRWHEACGRAWAAGVVTLSVGLVVFPNLAGRGGCQLGDGGDLSPAGAIGPCMVAQRGEAKPA